MGFFSSILGVFTGPFGTILTYLVGGLAIAGTLFTILKVHDHNIRVAALESFNKAQMEQTLKDKADMEAKLKKIEDMAGSVAKQQAQEETKIESAHDQADAFIDEQVKAGRDRPASELLKGTVDRLRNIE